ncbi:MAG: bestrophin family ion channel [Bacteroidia bacterium]
MYVRKNFSLRGILAFSGFHIIYLILWASIVSAVYYFIPKEYQHWLQIPWLPVSIIGTAVAFYVGFKNNSSYDRMWEARKIWGAIVNSSRMWATTAKNFVTPQFTTHNYSVQEIQKIHQRLFYRHIAWLYALRSQLLLSTSWEHLGTRMQWARQFYERRQKRFGVGLFGDDVTEGQLKKLLSEAEFTKVIDFQNTATQLIDNQSQELQKLREQGLIDDFRHMELQKILNDFYTHQGMAERIKKFPLPRQYASFSYVFVIVFIFLLPFGMIPAFQEFGDAGILLSIPFIVLVGWVYVMMELIGDYSENPFEGLGNDIPMLALCRTIEIDLREMLGETDLPPAIKPVNDVLM